MEVKNVPSWAFSELGSEDKKVTPFIPEGRDGDSLPPRRRLQLISSFDLLLTYLDR